MNDVRIEESNSGVAAMTPRPKFNFWRWFWLGTIPVSLGWLWYDFYAPDNHVIWAKDFGSAEQQATKSGKPMILLFTGTWCSPCRIMKRNVWADSQVEATVNAGFTPVMIDIDDRHEASVVNRYQVRSTPTTIITDPRGKVLQVAVGGVDKTHFLELLGRAGLSSAQ